MQLDAYLDDFTTRDWQGDPPDDRVRLAVIGLGGFARRRALPAIDEASFCEVGAVVSGSAEKAADVAASVGADRGLTYEQFHDGAGTEAYDAVYVVTPNARHLEYVETAAAFGKDVLCEKPLEATAERAERLVDACRDAGVRLMTAYRMQADPALRRMREMVRDGVVGEPVHVNGQFTVHVLAGDRGPDQWRLDPELAGGGVLMDTGIYPINAIRFVLGADPVAVGATTETPDDAFEAIDEHAAVQLSFPGAVVGTCTASYNAHEEDRLQVVGTEGQLVLDSAFYSEARRELTVERGLDERHEYAGPAVNEITEEFDYFAHALLADVPIEPDGDDGLTDVQIIEGAYESAETGSRVPL